MKKIERLARSLNDSFRDHLAAEMKGRYGVDVETFYDFFGSGSLVTKRSDGEDFTPEQHAWLAAWSEGYGCVLDLVRRAAP